MGIFNRSKKPKSPGVYRPAPLPITKLYFDLSILDETDVDFITHSVSFHNVNIDGQTFLGDGFLFYHKKLKMLFVCPNRFEDPDVESVFCYDPPNTRLIAVNYELYTSSLQDLGDSGILIIHTHNRGGVSVITKDLDSAKKMNSYLNRYCIKKRNFGSD